ncbi:nuclear transport factor 2 family protein [Shewanella surugensis]|uniref:Ester cyclase n=1 Tax=Shewanella surugensis TaxID=212020 RepID=A0ABT0LGQ0_9GAMM|nr:ester cyclase [Shewanella surugensis]MCL1126873.1 ester cyclase [Shewanella surugensis]
MLTAIKEETHFDGSNEAISKKNIETVLTFYDAVFTQRTVESCNQLMRVDYINHSQFVDNGRENFKAYFKTFYQKFKQSGTDVELVFADKDLVCLHATHWASNRLFTVKIKCVDIYKLQDGQLAEHWDSVEGLTVVSRLVFFLKSFLKL